MKKKNIILICIGAVLLIGITILLIARPWKKEVIFTTTFPIESKVEVTVTATGYVQPVEQVEVGTQVSGVIEKIYVDYNSQVVKGQLLAELDKLTLNEKLIQARASLSSAQSDMLYAQQTYDRVSQLYDVKASTQATYEEAANRLEQAKTAVANAQANVHQAEVNLSYAEIYSPINGVILNRAVEEGQTVAASFSTPTLFTIANDLTKMQVEADVDEADIGLVEVGQKVSFTVDAYSEEMFEGTVNQIRLQPTVTNNVVTYTVIVEAPNPEQKLFPGMTANITIVAQSEYGLTVPAAALTFNPNEEVAKRMNMPPGQERGAGRKAWIKQNENITPRPIETGMSDGIRVIAKSGLTSADEVVLSATLGKKQKNNQESVANPLMPRGPRRK